MLTGVAAAPYWLLLVLIWVAFAPYLIYQSRQYYIHCTRVYFVKRKPILVTILIFQNTFAVLCMLIIQTQKTFVKTNTNNTETTTCNLFYIG